MGTPTATERRELAFAGVARQAELVRSGAVTPRELVETALERIAELDPQLNSFRAVFAEQALAEADRAAGRIGAGEDLPLLGVPIAVKDDTPVGGEPRVLRLARARRARARGRRVRRAAARRGRDRRRHHAHAGARGAGRSPRPSTGGITRNPWDLQRTPGGSSGGPGAAVAAALVPGATASDGAGSIRIPAACCGLFGLKTTRGLVPTAPYETPFGGLTVYGFLTRGVADAALLYEVVTGEPFVAAAQQDPPRAADRAVAAHPAGQHGAAERRMAPGGGVDRGAAALARPRGRRARAGDRPGRAERRRALPRRDRRRRRAAVAHPERLERRTRGLARLGRAARRGPRRARAATRPRTPRA